MFHLEHVSTVGALVRRVFGTDIKLSESTAVVGTSIARIAINNPRRVQLHVVNNGLSNVFYAFVGSGQVVALNGSDFIPPGGFVTFLAIEDGEVVGYELMGISTAAGNNLDVQEYEAV